MAGFRIEGNTSGQVAEVNSDHEVLIAPNQDYEVAGHVCVAVETNTEGDGVGRRVLPMDMTPDYRLRVANDSPLFYDNFSHTVLNTSKYKSVHTTATNAMAGGRLVLNSGNSVTAAHACRIESWSYFRLALSGGLYFDASFQLARVPQTNNVVELGMFLCATTAAPLDGVFIRFNASGVALGVLNVNGSETSTPLVTTGSTGWVPEEATNYHLCIGIHNDVTKFWIDDVLMGEIITPAAMGAPYLSMSMPLAARTYNSGTVSVAQRLEIANWSVTQADTLTNRLWPTVQAAQGNSCINAVDGATAGQTANYANTAAPASATLSNTAAGYTTLGGQWQFAAVAGAETDYALFAYLNPAGTATAPGKNLIIHGIQINTFNMGVVSATTATVLQWGIGVGSSGVSLATADSATAVGRAPRRLILGVQYIPVGSVIGYVAPQVYFDFNAPITVEPGSYFHVILKMPVGTATASQIIRGTCLVNGHFE